MSEIERRRSLGNLGNSGKSFPTAHYKMQHDELLSGLQTCFVIKHRLIEGIFPHHSHVPWDTQLLCTCSDHAPSVCAKSRSRAIFQHMRFRCGAGSGPYLVYMIRVRGPSGTYHDRRNLDALGRGSVDGLMLSWTCRLVGWGELLRPSGWSGGVCQSLLPSAYDGGHL